MKRAMDETDRRRVIQVAYNKEHGITPEGIIKNVTDIMEGARSTPGKGSKRGSGRRVAEPSVASYADAIEDLSPKALASKINKLEQQMYQHSRDLEFEEAANVRDRLEILKKRAFVG